MIKYSIKDRLRKRNYIVAIYDLDDATLELKVPIEVLVDGKTDSYYDVTFDDAGYFVHGSSVTDAVNTMVKYIVVAYTRLYSEDPHRLGKNDEKQLTILNKYIQRKEMG